jgi:hypothetical protein
LADLFPRSRVQVFRAALPGEQTICVQTELTTERVARNQSTFRAANEDIERRAEELVPDAEQLPFICECPKPACTSVALLSLVDYEMVRSNGDWFFAVPGHEVCVVNNQEVAKIAKRCKGFTLMEKVGHAGEVARQLDPRS